MWFSMIYAGIVAFAKCIFTPCRRYFNDPDAQYARPDVNVTFTSGTNGVLYYSIV